MNWSVLRFICLSLVLATHSAVAQEWIEHRVEGNYSSPTEVDAADLDRDGDMDMICCGSSWDGLTWWENTDGYGLITTAHTITQSTVYHLLLCDLDGDNDLDIVTSETSSVVWYENQDGSGFSWLSHVIQYSTANSLSSGDMDGDGDRDLVLTSSSSTTWMENTDGSGLTWDLHTVEAQLSHNEKALAGDLDDDGDLDIAGVSEVEGIVWYENLDGEGDSWQVHSIDQSNYPSRWWTNILVVEMTGDGSLDILALGRAERLTLFVNVNDGDGWNDSVLRSNLTWGGDLHTEDLDRDGDLDILYTSREVTYLERTSTGWAPRLIVEYGSGEAYVSAADMNGDGDIEILTTITELENVSWWDYDTGPGTRWQTTVVEANGPAVKDFDVADMDGDGDLDAAFVSGVNDILGWTENTAGNGSSWGAHFVGSSVENLRSVHVADLDDDNDPDLIVGTTASELLGWYENIDGSGQEWSPHPIDDRGYVYSIVSGDVDGDGDLDVISASSNHPDISWHENLNGAGLDWTLHVVEASFGMPRDVQCVDFDADGDLDIVAGSDQNGVSVRWWENEDGTGTTWVEHDVAEYEALKALDVADLDGDGDIDIAAVSADLDGDVSWWENLDGTGESWVEHSVDPYDPDVSDIDLMDLDRDGDIDVIVTAAGVTWWENIDDLGTLWVEHTVLPELDGSALVRAADFSGDGAIDLFVASKYATGPVALLRQNPISHPPIDFELVPTSSTAIPASGGVLRYNSHIANNTALSFTSPRYRSYVRTPGGSRLGPISNQVFELGPFSARTIFAQTQFVPAAAPAGLYYLIATVTDPEYPGQRIETALQFMKSAATRTAVVETESGLPVSWALSAPYPNPFNAQFTVTVYLPEMAEVRVAVFNVLGCEVATLLDGYQAAGVYPLAVNAGDWASGVYFVRAKIPAHREMVRKAVLLR